MESDKTYLTHILSSVVSKYWIVSDNNAFFHAFIYGLVINLRSGRVPLW